MLCNSSAGVVSSMTHGKSEKLSAKVSSGIYMLYVYVYISMLESPSFVQMAKYMAVTGHDENQCKHSCHRVNIDDW